MISVYSPSTLFVYCLSTLLLSAASTTFSCLHPACNCQNDSLTTISVTCVQQATNPLHRIPLLPPNVSHFFITGSSLGALHNRTFYNLPHLKKITIEKCKLGSIQNGAFDQLPALETLHFIHIGHLSFIDDDAFIFLPRLQNIKIFYIRDLPIAYLHATLKNLNFPLNKDINLDYSVTNGAFGLGSSSVLKENHLQGFGDKNIRLLTLQRDSLSTITVKALREMRSVRCLSLAYNLWSSVTNGGIFAAVSTILTSLKKLRVLHLTGQGINQQPDSDVAENSDFVNAACSEAEVETLQCPPSPVTGTWIKNYSLTNNYSDDTFFISLPPSLQRLYMNELHGFKSHIPKMFFFSNRLTHFYLRNAGRLNLLGDVVGLSCLRVADLSGTYLNFFANTPCWHYEFPSLEFLNLSATFNGYDFKYEKYKVHDYTIKFNRCLLRNLPNLKTLDLSNNKIEYLDMKHFKKDFPNLTHLILKTNKLVEMPILTNRKLQLLDLSGNLLTELNGRDRRAINHLNASSIFPLAIDLRNNPLVCRCNAQSKNFITWFQSHYKLFVHGEEYECVSEAKVGPSHLVIKNLDLTHFSVYCSFYPIIISVSVSLFIVILMATLCIATRYSMILQYYLFKCKIQVHRLKRAVVNRTTSEDEFELLLEHSTQPFVYIVFAETDWSKAQQLGTFLEQNTDYCAWYHDKNFATNLSKVDNVFLSLEKCTHCVTILSANLFTNQNVDWPLIEWGLKTYVAKNPQYVVSLGIHPLPWQEALTHNSLFLRQLLQQAIESRGEDLQVESMQLVQEKLQV